MGHCVLSAPQWFFLGALKWMSFWFSLFIVESWRTLTKGSGVYNGYPLFNFFLFVGNFSQSWLLNLLQV